MQHPPRAQLAPNKPSLLKPASDGISVGRKLGPAMMGGARTAFTENFQPGRGGLPSMWPMPADPPRLLRGCKARSHGQTAEKRSKGPTASLAIRPLTCTSW